MFDCHVVATEYDVLGSKSETSLSLTDVLGHWSDKKGLQLHERMFSQKFLDFNGRTFTVAVLPEKVRVRKSKKRNSIQV